VQWTGGDKVYAQLMASASYVLACSFPASVGRGVIPAALLETLLPSPFPNDDCMVVGTETMRRSTAGDWTISTFIDLDQRIGRIEIH
jgi:hypothetical protein